MITFDMILDRLPYKVTRLFNSTNRRGSIFRSAVYHGGKISEADSTVYITRPEDVESLMIQAPVYVLVITDPDSLPAGIFKSALVAAVRSQVSPDEVNKKAADVIFHYSRIFTDMFYCAVSKDTTFQQLLDLAFEVIDIPIMLGDSLYNILACTHSDLYKDADNIWETLKMTGYLPEQGSTAEEVLSLIHSSHMGIPVPTITPFTDTNGWWRISTNFIINDRVAGHITIVDTSGVERQSIIDCVTTITEFCRLKMLTTDILMQNNTVAAQSLLLIELLDNNDITHEEVISRLKGLTWIPDAYLYVAVISDKRPERSLVDRINFINTCFNGKAISTLYKLHTILLIASSNDRLEESADFKAFEAFCIRHDIRAGISLPYSSITDTSHHYREALAALEYGEAQTGGGSILWFKDYQLSHIISLCTSTPDPRNLCSPALFSLMKYDSENNSDLLNTLRVYLSFGMRKTDTANQLHIQRTTLDYRLNKILNMTDISFENPDHILHLMMSFKILDHITPNQQ